MDFNTRLLETAPFDYERAKRILVPSGFMQGIKWNGESSKNSETWSIKLPSEGFVEIDFFKKNDSLAEISSFRALDRKGEEVPGMTADYNIARQVIAYAAGWTNKEISENAFWAFDEQVTKGDIAFLRIGAVDMADKWFDVVKTKFPPPQKRIEKTIEFYGEKE